MWPAGISTRAKNIIGLSTPLLATFLLNHSSLPLRCFSASPANGAVFLLTLAGTREFLIMLYRFFRWYRER